MWWRKEIVNAVLLGLGKLLKVCMGHESPCLGKYWVNLWKWVCVALETPRSWKHQVLEKVWKQVNGEKCVAVRKSKREKIHVVKPCSNMQEVAKCGIHSVPVGYILDLVQYFHYAFFHSCWEDNMYSIGQCEYVIWLFYFDIIESFM